VNLRRTGMSPLLLSGAEESRQTARQPTNRPEKKRHQAPEVLNGYDCSLWFPRGGLPRQAQLWKCSQPRSWTTCDEHWLKKKRKKKERQEKKVSSASHFLVIFFLLVNFLKGRNYKNETQEGQKPKQEGCMHP
jgi:hypothetical protein